MRSYVQVNAVVRGTSVLLIYSLAEAQVLVKVHHSESGAVSGSMLLLRVGVSNKLRVTTQMLLCKHISEYIQASR